MDWQLIETAPKDGEPIIGLYWDVPWADNHMKGEIVKCWYQPEFDAFISSARQQTLHNGYTFEDGSTTKLHSPVIEKISHWIPFPPPQGRE